MSVNGRNVIIADYWNSEVLYELGDDGYIRQSHSAAGPSGLVGWLKAGLRRRVRIPLALYALDDKLLLRVGSTTVDLSDEATSVRIRRSVPFVRRMVVSRSDQTLARVKYWASLKELSEWPVFGDLPDYIESATLTVDARKTLVQGWMLSAAGVDPSSSEGQAQLERASRGPSAGSRT